MCAAAPPLTLCARQHPLQHGLQRVIVFLLLLLAGQLPILHKLLELDCRGERVRGQAGGQQTSDSGMSVLAHTLHRRGLAPGLGGRWLLIACLPASQPVAATAKCLPSPAPSSGTDPVCAAALCTSRYC